MQWIANTKAMTIEEAKTMDKPTVIFDFDGVIHSYTSGWKDVHIIPDPPVVQIGDAIRELRKHYRVVVVSSRCATQAGIDAIKAWLVEYEIEVDDIIAHKPPAIVTIDDRAITFDGNANELLRKIQTFRPWYQKPAYERGDVVQIKDYIESWGEMLATITAVKPDLLYGYIAQWSDEPILVSLFPGDVVKIGHTDLMTEAYFADSEDAQFRIATYIPGRKNS